MAWGEVCAALQQKVIDGQENPIAENPRCTRVFCCMCF
ncbi:MAG TPA: hypothetical protein VN521_10090 [Negativicutes bacterium]|nr:hypothetical protein [Negativicutes bacterium]